MATTNTFTATLLFIFFCVFFFLATPTSSSTQEQHEEELLLDFKSAINDPASALSDWSPETSPKSHFCNWTGVSCSAINTVASLELPHLNLSGDISASACLFPHLSSLNLAHNNFNSSIPSTSPSAPVCAPSTSPTTPSGHPPRPDLRPRLAPIPRSELQPTRGPDPAELGIVDRAPSSQPGANLFAGTVDPSIFANLTQLVVLDLSQNPNLGSELPEEIGSLGKLRLSELEVLDLSQNNFTGNIPLGFGFGNRKLVTLDLSQNKLSGLFPADVCFGKALVELSLHDNSFIGVIANSSLGNCSALQRFQVQNNGFGGAFPSGLWSLPDIRLVRAENNRFSGQIPELASIPPRLEQVQIDNNSFSGGIPQNLG
uniref:Leucine-rich repeat-containing N-terminal plant-type domain-containing protein n=1 Tax=Ananas comosus var. bracteatus TaxID=296719 RepID=A0A6V7P3E4_ANACO|nr:unnamed protein product [Ananas comosus var. bracteatus]